jgi:hypothetical protein
MNGAPIYVSKRTGKNLWQEYRVYPDRLELQSWCLVHTLVVPASEILSVEIPPPGFIGGIKLDNCNLCRHVVVIKKSGLFKRIGFVPDAPEKFAAACRSILPNQ